MPVLLLAIAVVISSSGQNQPKQVFRSGIDLVQIDAVVLDRNGRPVTDLTAADFSITANKRARRVVSAEFVPASTAPIAPALDGRPVPAVTANAAVLEPRSFLFVVDVEQIRAGEGRVAMGAAAEFLSSLRPGDLAGVVAVPYGRPRVDLTTNRPLVRQALEGIFGAARRRDDEMSIGEASMIERGDRSVLDDWRDRHGKPPCSELPDPDPCVNAGRRVARLVLDEDRRRSRSLFDTLRALSEAMRPLAGLKTIVLVSEGMIGDREVTADLRRFAESAAAARVTLHSLALDIPQTEAADGRGRPPDRSLDVEVRMDGLAQAAIATGGEVFLISGTPAAALRQIDAQMAGYYLIAFESDPSDAGGKRRTIDVKVRRPNVRVRARTEFSIPRAAETAKPESSDLRTRMAHVLRWPLPVADVPVDLAAFASPAAPGETQRRVIIAAELAGGTTAAAAGFEIVDEMGRVVTDAFDTAPVLHESPNGPTYFTAVLLQPGRYVLKFAVLTADRGGSVHHPIEIEAGTPGALRIGDILIGRDDEGDFKPMARLSRGMARLAIRVELQATAPEAFEGASVLLEILQPGQAAPVTSATIPIVEGPTPLRRIATAGLKMEKIPAGQYILRCTLQGGASPQRVSRLIEKR